MSVAEVGAPGVAVPGVSAPEVGLTGVARNSYLDGLVLVRSKVFLLFVEE